MAEEYNEQAEEYFTTGELNEEMLMGEENESPNEENEENNEDEEEEDEEEEEEEDDSDDSDDGSDDSDSDDSGDDGEENDSGDEENDNRKKSSIDPDETAGAPFKKVSVRFLSALAALFIIALIFMIFAVNSFPTARGGDFSVGTDYIDYSFRVSDLKGYELFVTLENDYEDTRTMTVREGLNRGIFEGLTPGTAYRFKVSGKSKFGKSTLISKRIVTGSDNPNAGIALLTQAADGTVGFRLKFYDPEGKIEKAEYSWEFTGKNASEEAKLDAVSGGETVPAVDAYKTIGRINAEGELKVSVYCTAGGQKMLFAEQTLVVRTGVEAGENSVLGVTFDADFGAYSGKGVGFVLVYDDPQNIFDAFEAVITASDGTVYKMTREGNTFKAGDDFKPDGETNYMLTVTAVPAGTGRTDRIQVLGELIR